MAPRSLPIPPRRFQSTRFAALAALAMAVASCSSNTDDVCDNVGACTQGGSSDWIVSCKAEAKLLQDESSASGCASQFDAYYTCASSNFECTGATAGFPGCEAARAALDACLARSEAKTSCGKLAAKTATCGSPTDSGPTDSGPTDSGPVPAACSANRDCQARCFLDQVANVCAPGVAELASFSSCAAACPP